MNEDIDGAQQQRLFSKAKLTVTCDLPPEPLIDTGSNPVWTDSKARFIMLYLRYFVYITHHGARGAIIANTNLTNAEGLESCAHAGPSSRWTPQGDICSSPEHSISAISSDSAITAG